MNFNDILCACVCSLPFIFPLYVQFLSFCFSCVFQAASHAFVGVSFFSLVVFSLFGCMTPLLVEYLARLLLGFFDFVTVALIACADLLAIGMHSSLERRIVL